MSSFTLNEHENTPKSPEFDLEEIQKPLSLIQQEFDPLKDWIISFDSPQKQLPQKQEIPLENNTQTLLDIEPVTAKTFLFTQKDLDDQKAILEKNFNVELQLAQNEIKDLFKKQQELNAENCGIKDTLAEWEKAVKIMIGFF